MLNYKGSFKNYECMHLVVTESTILLPFYIVITLYRANSSPGEALIQEVLSMFRAFWWEVNTHWLNGNLVHGREWLQMMIGRTTSEHFHHCTAKTPIIHNHL